MYQLAIDVTLAFKLAARSSILDNITILSSFFEDHKNHIRTVLKLMLPASLTLRLYKSACFRQKWFPLLCD